MELILASASPRRRELLSQIGVQARVAPAEIDEQVGVGEAPADYVVRLAREKAQKIFTQQSGQYAGELAVLGADTTVVYDNQILGKPNDFDESCAMLKRLSNSQHQVVTGVALVSSKGVQSCIVSTEVWFRALNDDEISAYWASGEPQDKAGSYGIQGLGAVFVDHIVGSYSAVVGLPLAETAQMLREAGVPIWRAGAKD